MPRVKNEKSMSCTERFMSRIEVDPLSNCWIWQGNRNAYNYGLFRLNGRQCMAHRASLMLLTDNFNENLLVCHHCDNPPCVNPAHLFQGTHKDNTDDRIKKGRPGPSNQAHGEANGQSVLTDAKVLDIISKYAEGLSQATISQDLGISKGAVAHVLSGRHWKHITNGQKRYRSIPRTNPKGILNGHSKLTDQDIRDIRNAYAKGGIKQVELASRYNLTQGHVSAIIRKANWSHVE